MAASRRHPSTWGNICVGPFTTTQYARESLRSLESMRPGASCGCNHAMPAQAEHTGKGRNGGKGGKGGKGGGKRAAKGERSACSGEECRCRQCGPGAGKRRKGAAGEAREAGGAAAGGREHSACTLRTPIVVSSKPRARLNVDCIEPSGFCIRRDEQGAIVCVFAEADHLRAQEEDPHTFVQRDSEEYLALAGIDAWWDRERCKVLTGALHSDVCAVAVRGLRNSGQNLCFLNVVLQALLSLPPFRALLTHAASLRPLHNAQVLSALILDWLEYIKDISRPMLARHTAACIPLFEEALSNAQSIERDYGHHQHDPHEFLEWLLDTVHEELVSLISHHSSLLEGAHVGKVGFGENVEEWTEVGKGASKSTVVEAKFDESAVSALFRVMVRSVFKRQGQKASARVEPSLAMPISIDRVGTLMQALERHLETEHMIVDHTSATKSASLETLPPVLVLQLKRFEVTEWGIQKTNKRISFPSTLVLPEYMVSKYTHTKANENRQYILRSGTSASPLSVSLFFTAVFLVY
eukprot:TRINITY_DN850_c0_g2_i1.p1 TRINITY_DN850_c0_g2~~TRINITY_DN850_c0_g2_i1.p1  ORF type:complete len:524 (+),score=81.02 TRINITY_DN850_c0_g2_i1:794-2365(+)